MPRTTPIPRTSGYVHPIDSCAHYELEDSHDDYPVTDFLPQFYDSFKNRIDICPDQFYIQPQPPSEAIQIPDPINSSIEKVIVHLLDLPSLNNGKKQSQYIHSWCDISAVTSVEAKRMIDSFFTHQYTNLYLARPIRVELSWAKSINLRWFNKPVQTMTHSIRIFHYIGLGYPAPEESKIWLSDTTFSHGSFTNLSEIKQTLLPPSLLIFDCDKAAVLSTYLASQDISTNNITSSSIINPSINNSCGNDLPYFAFFACSKTEQLRIPSTLPQNFFSCILLSPAESFSAITGIKITDLSMFTQLLNIFTETIALDTLPSDTFYRLFRNNPVVACLWQRFFLAQRLMHTFGLHSQSFPEQKDTSEHQLWYQFEYALMSSNNIIISNPIIKLSNMYNISFDGLDRPPHYVSAFIASLLQIPELHVDIMHRIANFMSKSPQNCYTMGKVLNFRNFGDFAEISRSPDKNYFADWCCVLSGFLLVVPSLTKILSNDPNRNDLMKICLNTKYSDSIRVHLLSILVALRDSQAHLTCVFNTELTTDRFLPIIFSSSPILREWIVIFCHSSFARFVSGPENIGPTGIHAIMMLMLDEKRKFTRATALTVFTTIMAGRYPEYNDTIINCAIKAVIDGSHIVRHAFLLCAAQYFIYNKAVLSHENGEKMEKIDILMRKNIHLFCSQNKGRPHLTPILEFLQNDPYEENRSLARQILTDIEKIDINTAKNSYACLIHKMAHTLLFSQKVEKYHIHQRYCDNFFSDDQLEQFELIDTFSGPIVSIAFDFEHKTFCTASANGIVVWGENRWKVCDGPIQAICPLPGLTWAVVSDDGVVYIYRDGFESPVDMFRPSTSPSGGTSVVLSVPGRSLLFISQGNNEILIWDAEALLLINRIVVDDVPKLMALIDGILYVALMNGVVLKIDINDIEYKETIEIEKKNDMHKGQNIARIGNHNGTLFSAADNGPLYFWEDFEFPRQITDEWEKGIDFLVHPVYPIALKIKESTTLLQLYEDAPIELQTHRNHCSTCCCFDGDRPLCAIGFNDGFVSVWRITKPRE